MGLAQKDTIDSISVNLANTMDLIQQFHHTTDVEVPPVFLNIVELLLYIKGKDSHHFSQNAVCSQCALKMNGFLFFNKKDGKVHACLNIKKKSKSRNIQRNCVKRTVQSKAGLGKLFDPWAPVGSKI